MERAILYVDGFHFYHGVTKHWARLKGRPGLGWCDFRALVEHHFRLEGAHLDIKYFSAPVHFEHEAPNLRKEEARRYGIWTRALRTVAGIQVVEGYYRAKGRAVTGPEVAGAGRRRQGAGKRSRAMSTWR